jgi:hypothetical protein
MKIPGAERDALLEIFCPLQGLCRERTTPVRKPRVDGRKSVLRGEATERGCHRSTLSSDRKKTIENELIQLHEFRLGICNGL